MQGRSISIISRDAPEGKGFKILGVKFDTSLHMDEAISSLSAQANWKLRRLIQTQKSFSINEIMTLFKSRVLGYIEYRTPAIYHASAASLSQIDAIHKRLLRAVGITQEEALLNFRLAPLHTRRDMGMMGVIHRSVIGEGPGQFAKFFVRMTASNHTNGRENQRRHDKQLVTHRKGKYLDVMGHSILGLIDIYNLLPQWIIGVRMFLNSRNGHNYW